MSAATAPALEKTPQRSFSRHPISVPVDLIALRSGVPENLPGRCTDISEVGVGAIVAAEMVPGQLLAVELRLPNVGVPVRARAVVRYQIRLQCGLEFVGLSAEQRAMIRYWVHRSTTQRAAVPILVPKIFDEETGAARFEGPAVAAGPAAVEPSAIETAAVEAADAKRAAKSRRRVRIGRRGIYALMACVLGVAGLGSWQWQRSWNELEKRVPDGQQALRVSPEIMERRIVKKVDPVYPEAARAAGAEGMVVLDAVIAADGSVKRVQPVSGPDLLVQSATEAVRSWRFEPYVDRSSGDRSSVNPSSSNPSSGDRSSGKAVEVETTIAVEFRLH
jgi:TonB family protein